MAMVQNRWSLPIEITTRIIRLACRHELDRQPYCYSTRNYLPGVANYAGVCRGWQDLVERHTFSGLQLNRARLADVDRILCRRRQAYVRSVYFVVELEPYGPEMYGEFETAEEKARNSAIFSETLRLFFDIFSRWAPGAGISLCITAFSPSDTIHCGEVETTRRQMDMRNRDIYSHRYKHSILQLLTELPVVERVSELTSFKDRLISASAWALIINSLPNAKKIDVEFWENEKKDLELRARLRDEIGDALAQMRCPNAVVKLSCSYETPKDHSSIPPIIHARGVDDAFARGLRTWARQLKELYLFEIVVAPEFFYAASDGQETESEWPYMEQLEVTYTAVTPHGTWLIERNPEDSPRDRPSPIVDLDEFGPEDLTIEVPPPEDLYEWDFRTLPVASELDPIFRSAARAAKRMPKLRYLFLGTYDVAIQWGHRHHGFLYRYNAIRGVATAHWGYLPGYTPAEDVVELWREMVQEVQGCQLEVMIDENDV
ncbi:hypothetical protein ACQKWADRAFT_300273 [Trichoderma austrokoningii]